MKLFTALIIQTCIHPAVGRSADLQMMKQIKEDDKLITGLIKCVAPLIAILKFSLGARRPLIAATENEDETASEDAATGDLCTT